MAYRDSEDVSLADDRVAWTVRLDHMALGPHILCVGSLLNLEFMIIERVKKGSSP